MVGALVLVYLLIMFAIGIASGIVGALTGLGGGIVSIPILTLMLGVPIEYAAGASLISTIATSSGAASAYVKDKLANIKIGMSLEIATTLGAIAGALIAATIYEQHLQQDIFVLFGIVLLLIIYPTYKEYRKTDRKITNKDWTTNFFQLKGSYFDKARGRIVRYSGYRWWLGEAVMCLAGVISGLLGVGSGALKVVGMDWGMKLPIKVTTSTSNFMIGVTAAAGSAVYWALGYIDPFILGPIVIGILAGSYIGSIILQKTQGSSIRLLFLAALVILGAEMILKGIGVA